jgi:hypothetical protein
LKSTFLFAVIRYWFMPSVVHPKMQPLLNVILHVKSEALSDSRQDFTDFFLLRESFS